MHFPSQNQQNVKFLPKILIFQEPLNIETRNLHHLIWHALNHKYTQLKPFECIFPSQNQQNVKILAIYWTPTDKKWKKKSLWTGKKCSKRLENICTYKFLGISITMHYIKTLCDKYFWVMMVFLDLWQEGLGIGFWNMV